MGRQTRVGTTGKSGVRYAGSSGAPPADKGLELALRFNFFLL